MSRRHPYRRVWMPGESLTPNPRTPLNPRGPDSEVETPLSLVELPPEMLGSGIAIAPGYQRLYTLGECSVIVTREYREKWHLSIAHLSRCPTWGEISQARYRLLPADIWVAQYLPPPSQYHNVHRYCFHLLQCDPLPDEMQRYL